ncbi:MAG: hypothetical protein AAFU85_04515 [Planctomycetota bacterium]
MDDLANLDLPSAPLQQAPIKQAPFAAGPSAPRAKTKRGSRLPIGNRKPILVAASIAAVLIVLGGGLWFFLQQGGGQLLGNVLPGTIFDSGDAVLRQANDSDQELIRLADQIATGEVRELRDAFVDRLLATRKLVFRSVRVSPLSGSQVEDLFGDDASEGPLNSEARERIVDQVNGLADGPDISVIRLSITQASANTDFIREYLEHGHLELPAATAEGERIARKRIEILRKFNRLLATRVEKGEARVNAEMEKKKAEAGGEMPTGPPDEKTQQEIAADIDAIFGPIADDVQNYADQLTELAESRYELEDSEVGDEEQYDELFFYCMRANGRIFNKVGLLRGEGSEFIDAMKNVVTALQDQGRATRGVAPSTIAAVEREKEEADRKERARLAGIAQEKRREDARVRREKEAEEERKRQMAMNETPIGSAAPGDLAMDESTAPSGFGSPLAGGNRFGGNRGPRGRFGNGGPGSFPTGPRGGAFGGGSSAPTPIDTKTGFTIKMKDAQGLSTREISLKIQELKSSSRTRINNGELVVEGGYTGPLADVTKLIDFGKVVSVDEQTRTIVVERE